MGDCAYIHQNRLLHIGHVDELLELNHLYKQLAWNRFLQVRHGLDGSVRSFMEMMLWAGGGSAFVAVLQSTSLHRS